MRALLLFTAALALAAPALADTKDGVDAWERGDYKTAVDHWRAAAAKGDADAQFNLGQAYKLGRGVPADAWKAQDFYRQAAAQGHAQAADNYGLALFQNGKPRDALPYLEKATDRGDRRAQYILGTMLFNGVDIKKDWVRAYALLTRASQSGLPQASATLDQMNRHIPADQRQQGIAMAARLNDPQTAVAEVSGGGQRRDTPVATAAKATPPPTRVAAASTTKPPVALGAGRWRLQLGAFGDAGNAKRLGEQMSGRFPGRSVDYAKAGAMTRVLIGSFASRAEAQAACGSVKPCVPVGP